MMLFLLAIAVRATSAAEESCDPAIASWMERHKLDAKTYSPILEALGVLSPSDLDELRGFVDEPNLFDGVSVSRGKPVPRVQQLKIIRALKADQADQSAITGVWQYVRYAPWYALRAAFGSRLFPTAKERDANKIVNAALGHTILLLKSHEGDEAEVRRLLAAGARVDTACIRGRTALMEASFDGHEKVLKALIAAGARLDATDNEGVTALSLACANGRKAIARALLEAGADKSIVSNYDFDGRKATAIDFARFKGHKDIVKLLESS